jgi:membrane associated rhomboid family serine protease
MYGDDSYARGNQMPPAVKWILTANIIVFVAQMLRPAFMEYWFALWPNLHATFYRLSDGGVYAVNAFRPWQLVTYAFLHSTSTFTHILFNMLALWMFGRSIEWTIGTKRFTIFYFTCVVGAALTHLVYASFTGSPIPVLGASGGIFGVLLAFGILFPREKVYMLFIPVPIDAWIFVTLYGLLEVLNGLTNLSDGVAHFAHLGGMIFGFFLLQFWRGRFPFSGGSLKRDGF